MNGAPDVTLCIPAWQAATFIERTLRCARAQSYPAIRIAVSVDRGDDDTEAICRRHAAEDPRIDVVAQPVRLGWADNCNALLDGVQTPLFCLYFHDDVLHPGYIDTLRSALLAALVRSPPIATSAPSAMPTGRSPAGLTTARPRRACCR